MKIRNGFVSNSSSSSFLITFKSLPQTKEGLKELLFGKTDNILISNGVNFSYSIDLIVNDIFEKIHTENLLTFNEIDFTKITTILYSNKSFDIISKNLLPEYKLQYNKLRRQLNYYENIVYNSKRRNNIEDFKKIRIKSFEKRKEITLSIYEMLKDSLKKYKYNKFLLLTFGNDGDNRIIETFIENSNFIDKISVMYTNNH